MLLEYLLANSGVAAVLEPPVTLEELLTSLCGETMSFDQLVKLLERLPQFGSEKPITCDQLMKFLELRDLTPNEIKTLRECADFLDLPEQLTTNIMFIDEILPILGTGNRP